MFALIRTMYTSVKIIYQFLNIILELQEQLKSIDVL